MNPHALDVAYASRKISDAERQVLQFITEHAEEATRIGTNEIARRCYTSPTTVVRLAKKLGYATSREMLYDLEHLTNAPSGLVADAEGAYLHYSPGDLEALFSALDKRGTIALSAQGYSNLVTAYLEKKLLAFGCTTIQQNGLEASTVIDNFRDRIDAFIFVSKSGETVIIAETAQLAREAGIPVIGITGKRRSPLAQACDALFLVHDDCPLDIENIQPNFFFGYCLLAVEEMLNIYRNRHVAEETPTSASYPLGARSSTR